MASTRPAPPPTCDIGPVALAARIGILLLAARGLIGGYATGWGGRLRITRAAASALTLAAPVHARLDLSRAPVCAPTG